MTRLVIDIGNSRIKWALADGGVLTASSQGFPHEDVEPVVSAWAALPEPPDEVYWAGVIDHPVVGHLIAWIDHYWQVPVTRVRTPAEGGGIRIAYPDPTQLGTDRWLAMVGAGAYGLLPACIVDCGSAITLDAVDAKGQHHGGLILPGLAAQQAGLAAVAPALPAADLEPAAPLLATNTEDAVAAGQLQGSAAAIEQLATRLASATGQVLPLVLTGGDAKRIHRYLRAPAALKPDLVLAGLASVD